ncbi:MAG: ABC transporter ATP-binding protein [Actinomycetes bacterium]
MTRGLVATVRTRGVDVDIACAPEITTVVVGPNGAGKTTLLKAVAGLIGCLPGSSLLLDGRDITNLPAAQRRVGYVPQDGALFGHLDVVDNVAFGLRTRGHRRGEARRSATAWLDQLEIGDLRDRKPSTLSGGQAQRVALARALATDPEVLLLDEPLSAMDASARVDVRSALRRHLAGYRGVAIVVTHDPADAWALADSVVVLEAGSVTQHAPVSELAAAPRSPWIASLLGLNAWHGRATGPTQVTLDGGGVVTTSDPVSSGQNVVLVASPAAVALYSDQPRGTPRNVWLARVASTESMGSRVRVTLHGPPHVVAEVTPAAVASLRLVEGSEVWVSLKATEVTTIPL